MGIKRIWALTFLLLLLAGCKEKEEPETGATMDIMVVFAPGQLGDRGYADSVMGGLALLNATDKTYEHNLMELEFISGYDAEDTRESMKQWLGNPANPFYGHDYERRLLVLTEPYMAGWLEPVVSLIRPEDEVLLLKVNEEDVNAAAAKTGLGKRIHGLNISLSENIRRYCEFMKWYSEEEKVPMEEIPVFRVFDESKGFYHYRDSIDIAFREEFGDKVESYAFSLAEELGGEEEILSTQKQSAVMEMAYEMAGIMYDLCDDADMRFAVVDLGSANAGFDYYLLGISNDLRLQPLMIDATETVGINRYWVNRRWDKALLLWGYSWSRNLVGDMPVMKIHSRRDGYSEDNLPID